MGTGDWTTIHASFARAQKICPAMKKTLPENAKSTVVEGRIIYVCCPPCIDKIKADPKTHIKAVDAMYVAHVKAQADR